MYLTLSHIYILSDATAADVLFENIVTQCFPLLVKGYPLNYRELLFFDKLLSSAAELLYEGKG